MVQQPWWKKLLSQFVSFSIEKTESKYSKMLEVVYSRGRYSLRTENAVYSFEDLYRNFRESFYQIPLNDVPNLKVLVLGLGLASVPMMLEKLFHKKYNYTCVEIDEAVIRLAEKYGTANLQSPITLICADAYEFVKTVTTEYDLIIVDLFIDDEVPSQFEELSFLQQLRKVLSRDGWLLYNRMASNPAQAEKTKVYYEQSFVKIFPDADFITVGGNKVLLNKHK